MMFLALFRKLFNRNLPEFLNSVTSYSWFNKLISVLFFSFLTLFIIKPFFVSPLIASCEPLSQNIFNYPLSFTNSTFFKENQFVLGLGTGILLAGTGYSVFRLLKAKHFANNEINTDTQWLGKFFANKKTNTENSGDSWNYDEIQLIFSNREGQRVKWVNAYDYLMNLSNSLKKFVTAINDRISPQPWDRVENAIIRVIKDSNMDYLQAETFFRETHLWPTISLYAENPTSADFPQKFKDYYQKLQDFRGSSNVDFEKLLENFIKYKPEFTQLASKGLLDKPISINLLLRDLEITSQGLREMQRVAETYSVTNNWFNQIALKAILDDVDALL